MRAAISVVVDFGLSHLVDAGDEERIAGQKFADAEAARASGDHVMAAVGCGHIAQDLGDGADAMQMLGPGRLDGGIALQHHAHRLVGPGGGLRAGNGLRPAKAERHHDAGKQHGVAGGQDNQGPIRQLQIGGRCLLGGGSLGRVVHNEGPLSLAWQR